MTPVLLCDTNAFAMVLTADDRLPGRARVSLQEARQVLVSAISLYEIGQKVRLGKWPEMASHVAGLEQRARDDGFQIEPLAPSVALRAALLDWEHRDPFDRMIAGTALEAGLTLVSSDDAFDALRIPRIWG